MLFRENKKTGEKLSILGLGCMRFPKKGGKIDQEYAEEIMRRAIDSGVNYFDTAYIYSGSEVCVGEFLSKGYRDKVKIATKLPHYMIKTSGDMDKFFDEQKRRLQTDHVEYYLIHMLNDAATWKRLEELGIREWIAAKKECGEIINIGFSFHGGAAEFIPLVDAYDWDFCQIQYNYMDENTQAGKKGLEYAYQKDIPVIIMEPLRGGRLVNNLPRKAALEFEKTDKSPAEWGLRWIWNHREVTVILSGMSDIAKLEENVRIASEAEAGHMGGDELARIARVRDAINEAIKIPCTGCGYCMPCPAGVDIPVCFSAYNLKYTDGQFLARKNYFMCAGAKTNPTVASKCIGCGKCEKHCPQSIKIRDGLKAVKRELEGPLTRVGMKVARRFLKF